MAQRPDSLKTWILTKSRTGARMLAEGSNMDFFEAHNLIARVIETNLIIDIILWGLVLWRPDILSRIMV